MKEKNMAIGTGELHKPIVRVPVKKTKEDVEREMKSRRDRDSELVTGVFRNRECPANAYQSGMLQFRIKLHKGDEFKAYELKDGEHYRLPRGVVRHINENCYYKEYTHLSGEGGTTGIRAAHNDGRLKAEKMQASRKVHRFEFVVLEFLDDDDLDLRAPADLVEVSVSP